MHPENWIHLSFVVASLWAIVCRINLMSKATRHRVFLQYALLALGLFCSLMVPPAWQMLSVCAGVFAFLALSAPRWKDGAPPDTHRVSVPSSPLRPGSAAGVRQS